jgi:hypothetical protein
LQYQGNFVRVSVSAGPRANGGFEGELDVVAVHLAKSHLLHIECSLDSLSSEKREQRFKAKFQRRQLHIKDAFLGMTLPDKLEQVAVLQYARSPATTWRLFEAFGFS